MSTNPGRELLSNGTNFVSTNVEDTYPLIDPKQFNLKGRIVVITGASKGIGRATALSYAKAGVSTLVLGARTEFSNIIPDIEAAASEAGRPKPHIKLLKLDVTSPESVEEAARSVEAEFGCIDILINNAGLLEKKSNMADVPVRQWWGQYEANVLGVFLMIRSFVPLMIKSPRPDKTIINMSSVGAWFVGAGSSAYQTSKLISLRLTEFVNAEYGEQGLLAYALHPGGVMTELGRNLPPERHWILVDTVELGADVTVYLTSERREWLAGRYISAKWEMKEFLAKRAEIEKHDLLKIRMAIEGIE